VSSYQTGSRHSEPPSADNRLLWARCNLTVSEHCVSTNACGSGDSVRRPLLARLWKVRAEHVFVKLHSNFLNRFSSDYCY
jgi:hypothetical protein